MDTFLVILGIVVVAVLAIWYFNKDKGFDANKDGKVDLKDVKPLAQETFRTVQKSADVNKDGKVNLADVKQEVKKVVKKAKTAKAKVTKKPKISVAE